MWRERTAARLVALTRRALRAFARLRDAYSLLSEHRVVGEVGELRIERDLLARLQEARPREEHEKLALGVPLDEIVVEALSRERD